MTTDTIDRLFLELSQFTTAMTARELKLKAALEMICDTEPDQIEPAASIMRMRLIAKEALKP